MKFEEVFNVHVRIDNDMNLLNSDINRVHMIQFSGNVTGKYFHGKILPGGVDTQIVGKGTHTLSARYMLEGEDYKGEKCKIFIENNGSAVKKYEDALFKTYPKIITDSEALKFLNNDFLIGEAISTKFGLDIKIYRAI